MSNSRVSEAEALEFIVADMDARGVCTKEYAQTTFRRAFELLAMSGLQCSIAYPMPERMVTATFSGRDGTMAFAVARVGANSSSAVKPELLALALGRDEEVPVNLTSETGLHVPAGSPRA